MEATTIYISKPTVEPVPESIRGKLNRRFPTGENIPCRLHKIVVHVDKFVLVFRSGPYDYGDGYITKASFLEKEVTLSKHLKWISFLSENHVSLESLPDFFYSAPGRTKEKDKEYLEKLSLLIGDFFSNKVVYIDTYLDPNYIPYKVKPCSKIKLE